MPAKLSHDQQLGALSVLCYLQNLFTTAGRTKYTQTDVIVILDTVGNDPEIFEPGAMDLFKGTLTDED